MSETSGASSPSASAPSRPMSSAQELLKQARIASPCHVSWDAMPGGDCVRSCAHCQRKVYNLSEMTAADAAELIRKTEGRLCVRYFQRPDGTVMTRDCPTGLRTVRARAARGISVAFGALALACGFSIAQRPRAEYPFLLRLLADKIAPVAPPHAPFEVPDLTPAQPGIRVLPMAAPDPTVRMGEIAPPQALMGRIISAPPAVPDPTDRHHDLSESDLEAAFHPDPTVKPLKNDAPVTSFEDVNSQSVVNSENKSFLKDAGSSTQEIRNDPFLSNGGRVATPTVRYKVVIPLRIGAHPRVVGVIESSSSPGTETNANK